MVREIRQSDIDHWHEHGYVVIEEFLEDNELDRAREELALYLPGAQEYMQRQPLFANLNGTTPGPPGWARYEFPYQGDGLNDITLHPYLVGFVERVVGNGEIALSHGAIVGKYAGRADYDQELHTDFSNNTLAYPSPGVAQVDIPMIVYYTDVRADLGPTYVVPAGVTRDLPPDGRRYYPRGEYPELYAEEVAVLAPAGSVLIYSMLTVHRGSAMTAMDGARHSQFIGYHTMGAPWLGSHSFQSAGGRPEMDRLLTRATPRQRQLLGFPSAGDPYWTEVTLAGVASRYPGMDMSPYHEARQ